MNTLTSFFIITLLLVANGFFVAAEFALVKARGFRISSLADSGSSAAKLTLKIQNNLEAYLAACQLGITMASLGLGWVGEPAIAALLEPLFIKVAMPAEYIHTVSFIIGFLLFSSLHIVVGEQVPKTFAIRKAETVSVWVAYPLHFSYLMVYPLNWLLNNATKSILALFNVEEASHGDILSGEEIKGLVATSKEAGEIHHVRADMLKNLFEFDQRHVGRVMIPRGSAHVLDLSGDKERNIEIIRETGHSRFPVIDSQDDDNIVGIILTKDIYHALLTGNNNPLDKMKEFCRDPLYVPEAQKIAKLFELMRTQRAHMALVVDEYGTFSGVVTLEDLLEEIVGEIEDETDTEQVDFDIVTVNENQWEVDGLVSLTDVSRITGLNISHELDANTLSGLFMQRLARMPVAGDEVTEEQYTLKVLSLIEQRVGRTLITRQPDETAEPQGSTPEPSESKPGKK